MKNNKMIDAVQVVWHDRDIGSNGIRSIDLQLFRLEQRDMVCGCPAYDKRYSLREATATIHLQCNTSGDNTGQWYGSRITLEGQNKADVAEAHRMLKRVMPDNYDNISDCTKLIESVFAKCVHVSYDPRLSRFLNVDDVETLDDVRAWHDTGHRENLGGSCTVVAFTNQGNPSEEVIRDCIKKSMCKHGYADALVSWAQSGMEYKEVWASQACDKAVGIPKGYYINYPQTLIEPKVAWSDAKDESAMGNMRAAV